MELTICFCMTLQISAKHPHILLWYIYLQRNHSEKITHTHTHIHTHIHTRLYDLCIHYLLLEVEKLEGYCEDNA